LIDNKVIVVDQAILDDAANEAIVANKADDSKNEADGVLDNQLAELEKKDVEKLSKITVHLCCCWRPFSLTKHCAIFSKDRGFLCPIANKNQLGGRAMRFNRKKCWKSLSSLRMQRSFDGSSTIWSKSCSLRMQRSFDGSSNIGANRAPSEFEIRIDSATN